MATLLLTPSAVPPPVSMTTSVTCLNGTTNHTAALLDFSSTALFQNETSFRSGDLRDRLTCDLDCCAVPTVFCRGFHTTSLLTDTPPSATPHKGPDNCFLQTDAAFLQTFCANAKTDNATNCLVLSVPYSNGTIYLSDDCVDRSRPYPVTPSCNNTLRVPPNHKFGLTFRVYLSIALLGSGPMLSCIWPLLNAIAYSRLGAHRNSWGRQRAWGQSLLSRAVRFHSFVFTHRGPLPVGLNANLSRQAGSFHIG